MQNLTWQQVFEESGISIVFLQELDVKTALENLRLENFLNGVKKLYEGLTKTFWGFYESFVKAIWKLFCKSYMKTIQKFYKNVTCLQGLAHTSLKFAINLWFLCALT